MKVNLSQSMTEFYNDLNNQIDKIALYCHNLNSTGQKPFNL